MAYTVKYIGNCAKNHIDIRPLYEPDLLDGQRVVLVCEKEYSAQYYSDRIKLIDSPIDVTATDSPLMLLRAEKDAAKLAVECAFSIYCSTCQVYIKNDGLYTADPDNAEYAQRLDKIDYDEVSEICSGGYNEVNSAMVETAKKYGVALHMLSYSNPDSKGTVIKEVMSLGTSMVKGIIKEPDICIVSLVDIPDKKGISYRIFQAVSDAGVVVDMISLPASDYGRQDISFTIHRADRQLTEKILREKQCELGFTEIVVMDNVAKVSVVGSGVQSGIGVAAQVFRILYENDISLRFISTSEIKISVIVDKTAADLAVQKIHQYFIK